MLRKWRLRPAHPEAETILQRELGVAPLVARLLVSRGITTPEAARPFVSARLSENLRSPMLFREMPVASRRLLAAVQRGERIGIYGDYDVDGISGTAVLVCFLRALGREPIVYIPHRIRDGYGVTAAGIESLAERGAQLIITVDCGGNSHFELGLARERGIDSIVCDHHQVSGHPLPATAVLNPIEPDAGFPFQGLCGAGVAFYLAMGTRMQMRETGVEGPDLRRYLDLVTLGTIADIVPIVEENRVLVKHGLREILQTPRPGMVALKTVSGVSSISTRAVGFRLAPRLNAAGRLGDATRSLELLTTTDSTRAQALAAELDQENRSRQTIEQEILDQALQRIDKDSEFAARHSIVLASEEWHPGVVGIVASRLVERHHRPTVLIAIDAETGIGRGSGRTITGFNLFAAFRDCAEHLIGHGGHPMAAGLSIHAGNVEAFADQFDAVARARLSPALLAPEILVDSEVDLASLDVSLLENLQQLEPFGAGNPEPLLFSRDVIVQSARLVGERHVKLHLQQGEQVLGAIAFGMADQGIEVGQHYDILFVPEANEWSGGRTLQLRIRDIRPHMT